jgi:uncharacterized protein (TIGR03083 family)
MALVTADPAMLQTAIETVAERVAAMVRPLEDTSMRCAGTEWTVGETAAHLAWSQEGFSRLAAGHVLVHGDRTAAGIATANADVLSRFPERGGARLAEMILDGTRAYFEVARALPAGFTAHTPMGPMDLGTCTSYMLTHLMTHGWTIARSLGKRSPFDPAHVALTFPFTTYAMPLVLNKEAVAGLRACYDVQIRGGIRLAFMFDDGELTIAPAPTRKVDCHLWADPMALFLVGTRLVGQWGQIARFKLVAWGRKPWLAFRFVGFFTPA